MKTIREPNPTMEQLLGTAADIPADVLADPAVTASVADFPELDPAAAAKPTSSLNHLLDVTVCVTAELGRVTMTISDILKLGIGSVVGLDRSVSEPVDLLVQGVPFARGEVVVIDQSFAIRIREILDPKFAVKK